MSEVPLPPIPAHWTWAPLGEVADVRLGKMLSEKTRDNSLRQLPYLRNQNVRWGAFDLDDVKLMGFRNDEIERYSVTPGDLLVCEGGEPARCAVYVGKPGAFLYQKALHRVRPLPSVADSRFVQFCLWHYASNGVVLPRPSETTIQHLPLEEMRGLPVPLPPLSEQRRIVDALETQFTRLDAAVATLERVRANLKRYRAAVLQAAVEGRLVQREVERAKASGLSCETGAALVKRTPSATRPNRYDSRSRDVRFGHRALSLGNPGVPLPTGWCYAPLVEVARMESGHTPSRRHPEWWSGDVPWLTLPDARDHHGGTIHETREHTNALGLQNSAARLLPTGTVCMSRTASVGYVVVLGRPMATSQDFANWICTPALDPSWLRTVLMADREVLRRFGSGSVHTTIYFPELLALHVAVPPLAEQVRIAAAVNLRLSEIGAQEAWVESAARRITALRQSLLRLAFSGRLVPQDPADEPASVLLDRIRRERAAAATAPAKRKTSRSRT